MPRPVVYVLAGVNGAGKSSVGGELLRQSRSDWYNPDTFARELRRRTGCDQETANARAWQEGMRRLRAAIENRENYAFETTLGGDTVAAALLEASRTYDVIVWFCGLETVELHLERVRDRARAGGHDIPEAMIRERFVRAPANLVKLMPRLATLRVFDNSAPAAADGTIPDPVPVLDMTGAWVRYPKRGNADALRRTPDWAKPLVQAALALEESGSVE